MYRYWLANIPGMTPSKYEFIYRNCSCAEELYMLSDRAIEKMTGLSQKDAQSIVLSRKKMEFTAEVAGTDGKRRRICVMGR